jgi:tetratricopeptide (TPR) repeat protein
MRGRLYTAALAACTALAGLALAFYKVCDQDVFWHLTVGRATLETGRRVTTNLFSSLFPDHPWYNPEGGYDVLLGAAYRAGGWGGVAAFKLLLVGALGVALFGLLHRARREPFPAAALAVVALAAMRSRLTERPQLVTILLLVLTMLATERSREQGGRRAWLLAPLFALWANLHAGVLLGLLYLAGAAVGETLNGRRRVAGSLALATVLCLAATLANPGGWLILKQPFLHFGHDEIVAVTEFGASTPALVPLFWVLAAGALLALGLTRRTLDWAETLTLAGFLLLGARYVREVPVAAVAAALTIHRRLPDALPRRGVRTALVCAGVVCALAWSWRYDRLLPYRWGWGIDESSFPAAAVDFLERHELPERLYNHYNQGGYLIYRLGRRRGVFQDSRTSAYPAAFLSRLHARHGAGWGELLAEYGVGTALVRTEEVALFFPPAEWGLVYWDDQFSLLVRRAPGREELLERLEYRFFTPGYPDLMRSSDPGTLTALAGEMARSQAGGARPQPVVARDRGIVLGRLGRFADAEGALGEAVALDAGDAGSWLYLGLARERLGKRAEARAAYERALAVDPALEKAREGRKRLAADAP